MPKRRRISSKTIKYGIAAHVRCKRGCGRRSRVGLRQVECLSLVMTLTGSAMIQHCMLYHQYIKCVEAGE